MNSTVNWRRSPADRPEAGVRGPKSFSFSPFPPVAFSPSCLPVSGVAHSAQNLARGRFSAPQLGQRRVNGEAHSIQNLAPSGFSTPQLAQRMVPLYALECRWTSRTRSLYLVRPPAAVTTHPATTRAQRTGIDQPTIPGRATRSWYAFSFLLPSPLSRSSRVRSPKPPTGQKR